MKIAHTLFHTPHKSGLYETTREIAAVERAAGHDSRMVDPMTDVYLEDRKVPYARRVWMFGADVIVDHQAIGHLPEKHPPILAMLHGTPHYCFTMSQYHGVDLWTPALNLIINSDLCALVTFSQRYADVWSLLGHREKFSVIPPPVDLEYWSPNGASYDYDSATTNLVITDRWRPTKDSFNILIGASLYAAKKPNTRIHLYAITEPPEGALQSLLNAMASRDILGQVRGDMSSKSLRAIYRAADLVLTSDSGTARTIREAMACGCPVLSAHGDMPNWFTCDMNDPAAIALAIEAVLGRGTPKKRRGEARATATERFDPAKTQAALERLYKQAIEG